ncbi:ankyrin repeat, PH and SEC7 domain containing protein secG isoform X3 [Halyomorpha halys]|nr:ankyrin repeat, PH and SEC7 domain containing protein secG-like isoform X3 [Halyomorpha halys]XP_024218983.1 ankyrin repeat, PH and SEC7 domain containing protein secG-like isoform X3 [Halyomorpha halys]XP_024218984.1 ankyrin repeat, PH and SEC7 domain containing protein secG-like isoform X3 [Halyomorpha halys]
MYEGDINAETPLGNTALHIAASGGCFNVVKALLDKGAKVDCIDKDALTPLFKAVKGGNHEIASLLLNKGADVSILDSDGATLLHHAAHKGMTKLVEQLLEKQEVDPQSVDSSGQLPFHTACSEGHLDIVKMLLACDRSQVNCVIDDTKYTPLHEAAFWGRKYVVNFLLENNALINPKTSLNETPMTLAKKCGHTYVTELIRSKGGILDGEGNTLS